MKTIFISYPELFNCQSKFDRKVGHILSSLSDYQIIYQTDCNQLIANFFKSKQVIVKKITGSITQTEITHGIIFDDGVEFEIFNYLKVKIKDKLRVIQTPITSVANKNRGEDFDIYIGRGSPWGNPHTVMFGQDHDEEPNSREEAIRKYKFDFDYKINRDDKAYKAKLLELKGKVLGCHCKPYSCHGDVLANYLNQMDDEK